MKLPKSILHAMLVAVTTGAIISCEKPKVTDVSKPATNTPKSVNDNTPAGCPACGMG